MAGAARCRALVWWPLFVCIPACATGMASRSRGSCAASKSTLLVSMAICVRSQQLSSGWHVAKAHATNSRLEGLSLVSMSPSVSAFPHQWHCELAKWSPGTVVHHFFFCVGVCTDCGSLRRVFLFIGDLFITYEYPLNC